MTAKAYTKELWYWTLKHHIFISNCYLCISQLFNIIKSKQFRMGLKWSWTLRTFLHHNLGTVKSWKMQIFTVFQVTRFSCILMKLSLFLWSAQSSQVVLGLVIYFWIFFLLRDIRIYRVIVIWYKLNALLGRKIMS